MGFCVLIWEINEGMLIAIFSIWVLKFGLCTYEGGGDGPLDNNSGLLPNNCLPCLASTVDKKIPLSPGHPSFKKKIPSKLSFKWREW